MQCVCSLPEADEILTLGPHYQENCDSRDPKIPRDLKTHTRLLKIKIEKITQATEKSRLKNNLSVKIKCL